MIFIVYLYKAFNIFESFFDIIINFFERRDKISETMFVFFCFITHEKIKYR